MDSDNIIDISNTYLVSIADTTGWVCRIVIARKYSIREKYPYTDKL